MGRMQGGQGAAADLTARLGRLHAELVRTWAALAGEVVEVIGGDGAGCLVMRRTQECRALKIGPQLVAEGDVQKIDELIVLTESQALRESRLLAARNMGPLNGAPGGAGLLG